MALFEPLVHRALATALQAMRSRRFRAFEDQCRDPKGAQLAFLKDLVATHGNTALARRLGVPRRNIDIASFRAAVPLTSYEDVEPEIMAAFEGAADQLAPGHPIYFAKTSGTSGQRKIIPITEDYRRSFQQPMHLFLWSLQSAHPALFDRRVLYIVGPAVTEHSPAGVPVGYISGYNYQRMPTALRQFYAVPPEVFALADPETNAYGIARAALMHDLSFAIAVTAFPLAQLVRTLETHRERLLRDVRDGTFTPPGPAVPLRAFAVASHFRADPARARTLERRAGRAGAFAPWALWPHVEAVSCWYHAAAATALPPLEAGWRPKALRSALYSATEGWLNVPLRDHDVSGVAALDSVFFEFETLGPHGEPTGETCLLHEVEAGRNYGLVMTTRVGLWRYRIMDEIRVTGFFHNTPEFHFVQKAGAILSCHQDMSTAAHFEQAFAEVFRRVPTLAGARWLVWPEIATAEGAGRYGAALGLDDADIPEAALQLAAEAFDAGLGRANDMYRLDRDAGIIAGPLFKAVPRAAIEAWERARFGRGAGHQGKSVQLVKDVAEIPAAFRRVGASR
jgi:hypothetical protein